MDRKALEAIWDQVHPDLPIEGSPLTESIITEGMAEEDEDSPEGITQRLYTLSQDIEDLADAVCRVGQGYPAVEP